MQTSQALKKEGEKGRRGGGGRMNILKSVKTKMLWTRHGGQTDRRREWGVGVGYSGTDQEKARTKTSNIHDKQHRAVSQGKAQVKTSNTSIHPHGPDITRRHGNVVI